MSTLSNILRSHICVFASVRLHSLKALARMLSGQVSELLGLLNSDVTDVLQLGIDQLLVLGVDEWYKEDDTSREEGKAPGGKQLDEVIAEERCGECLRLSVLSLGLAMLY